MYEKGFSIRVRIAQIFLACHEQLLCGIGDTPSSTHQVFYC